MANLADKSGDAYSNLVNGTGSPSLTFTMPGNVALDVESVVATVDNAAGADTTATLTFRDPSGQVIATKRQGETVDAGASGTATWALRLDDEGASGFRAGATSWQSFSGDTTDGGGGGSFRPVWSPEFGTSLVDLSDPQAPLFLAAGAYAVSVAIFNISGSQPGKFWRLALELGDNTGNGTYQIQQGPMDSGGLAGGPWLHVAQTRYSEAGGVILAGITHDVGVNQDVLFNAVIQRLS